MSRFFTLCLLFLFGCAHQSEPAAPVDVGALRTIIAQSEGEYAKALMRGDAAALASFFAVDGQFVLASQKGVVQGRAAIQAFNEKRLQTNRYLDVVITTTNVGTSGDLAYETGTNRITRQPADSAPVTTTGRYLTVWHRESDGKWLIQVDMVATDPSP